MVQSPKDLAALNKLEAFDEASKGSHGKSKKPSCRQRSIVNSQQKSFIGKTRRWAAVKTARTLDLGLEKEDLVTLTQIRKVKLPLLLRRDGIFHIRIFFPLTQN